jgi:hypothetical protein
LREAQSEDERERLRALVGHDGDSETLSRELSELIRNGALDSNDPNLRAHVRKSLADALAINNPKWPGR